MFTAKSAKDTKVSDEKFVNVVLFESFVMSRNLHLI